MTKRAATPKSKATASPETRTGQIADAPGGSQPVLATDQPSITDTTSNNHTNRKWLIGGLILVGLLVSLVVINYLYLQPEPDASQTQLASQDRTFSLTPTPSPVSSASATPTAPTPPTDGPSLNLQPKSSQAISFEPQVEGVTLATERAAVDQVVAQSQNFFAKADAAGLYNIFSAELKAMFSQQNLADALAKAGPRHLEPAGEPTISAAWTKQPVVFSHDGSSDRYDLILHKEDGVWTLFGTMQSE